MKKCLIIISFLIAFLPVTAALGAKLYPGYAGSKWGSDFHIVTKTYRNGTSGMIGNKLIYKQINPNKAIRQRTFGFTNERLNAVSITYNPDYIKTTGVEKLLGNFIKMYGEGMVDRSSAPHLISHVWEDSATRITFAYSSERPEMTVLMFQQK